MYDLLRAQFEKPRALNQARHHHVVNKGDWPKYIWEFYPLAQDYYHEFNPYFVHLIPQENVFQYFPLFTVRDGVVAFADFLLKQQKTLVKHKSALLVPERFAPLLPENLRSQCLAWSVSQPRKKKISECKKVLIFGLLCDQYFGSFKAIEERLKTLRDLPAGVKIEVCLGLRRNPFQVGDPENLNHLVVVDLIRKHLPSREIAFVMMKDVTERAVWKDTYVLDLLHDDFLVSDSYFSYLIASRGASVGQFGTDRPGDALFDLALSFQHTLHVRPLPEKTSVFNDLLFFRKFHAGELLVNKNFHNVLRSALGPYTRPK